ncbi:glycosyltransferase family 4 protein [Myroides sp. LJL115]
MKILHVVSVSFALPYFIGDQINYLKENGVNPTIACSPSEDLLNFGSKYSIPIFEVNISRRIDPITDLKSVYKLVQFIREEKFDFVIGHTPKGALLAMLASKLVGTKNRIYFRHGLVFETSRGFKLYLLRFLEKLTSMCASQIVCVSQSVYDYSVENGFGSALKNIVLNKGTCNGVDTIKYSKSNSEDKVKLLRKVGIPENNIVIGYVGRLSKDKGIRELVEAWKELLKKYSNISLLLVGPLDERDGLDNSVLEFMEGESSIILTGNQKDTKLYYNLMDIFVLPSYREGFPTVVLEASSMELPIITTRSTGCKDSIIEGVTGVFSNISEKDLSDKISYYIDNPGKRKEHGKNGREWILENFKQELVWEVILKDILLKKN